MAFRKSLSSVVFVCGLAAALEIFLAGSPASAQTLYTWSDSGTDWSTQANWSPTSGVPGAYDVAQFDAGIYNNNPSVNSASQVGGIWDTGGGAVSIGGAGPLTINGATLNGNSGMGLEMDAGAGPLTINAPLVLGGAQTWLNNSASLLTVNGNVSNEGNLLTFAGGGNTAFSGSLSGNGGLTMNGTGALTLAGGNSAYQGSTTLSGGTLAFGGAGNNLSGAVTVGSGGNAATLLFQKNSVTTFTDTGETFNVAYGSTLAIQPGASLTIASALKLGAYANNSSGTVNQSGGALTVTSSDFRPLCIGEYSSETSVYNLSGGVLNVPNNWTYVPFHGSAALNISGGTAELLGISVGDGNWGYQATPGTICVSGSGGLYLGSNGISNPWGLATVNLSGGTLGAYANWSSSVPMTLSNAPTIDTQGNTITLTGPLSGGGLNKIGTGTLNLTSSANNISGGLSQSAGVLSFAGAIAVSGPGNNLAGVMDVGTSSTNPGTLVFSDNCVATFTSAGDGRFNVAADSTVFVQPGASLTLACALKLGALGGGPGNVVQSGGTLTINDSSSGRPLTIGEYANETSTYTLSGGVLNVPNGATYVPWDGAAALDIAGGTASLAGIQIGSYDKQATGGTIAVSAGALYVGSGGIFSGYGPYTVNLSGGTLGAYANWSSSLPMTLANAPTIDTQGGTITLSGGLSGTGSLTKINGGLLALNASNVYSGGTAINGGTLQLGNNFALGSTSGNLNVASGAVLDINGYSPGVGALSGSGTIDNVAGYGSPTLTVGNGDASGAFAGVIQNTTGVLALTKTGAGTQVLSGSNTYSGATTISGGTLQIGNGGSGEYLASPSVTVSNNATLAFNHSDPLSYGGAISGSGQLIKLGVGVLDLTGTSTYSGPTTISAGTLELDVNGNNLPTTTALSIASSSVLDMDGVPQTVGSLSGSAGAIIMNHWSPLYASTLTVAPSSGSTTFAGNITSNVALAVSGNGALTLSGTNSYTGGTTISGGTLDIAAPSALSGSGLVTIAAGGRLVLGSGAGIGALLAASSPVGLDAVALSAAEAPATLGGYESASGNMATLGGAPASSEGGAGSAVGGTAAAVPEPGTFALLGVGALGLIGWARRRRKAT